MVGHGSGTLPPKSVSSPVPSALCTLHQVLGRVVGVLGHQLGVLAADVVVVVVLEDVAARGLRDDDGGVLARASAARMAPASTPRSCAPGPEVLDVAAVQPRRAAAHLAVGHRALMPLRSYTRTRSLPTWGAWYSTMHVGNTMAAALARPGGLGRRRLRHQVENRSRAYGGSTRSLAMPVTFSISLRPAPPGLPTTLLTTGASAVLTLPARSVRPSAWSVTFADTDCGRLRCRTCSAQHQPGEVQLPLVLPGDVRAVHVAELALEALVDDLVLLGRRHLGRVLVVVLVDEVEQRGERRAELEAQPAAVAQVVDPVHLLAEVGLVEVAGVEGVVGGGHRSSTRGPDAGVDRGARNPSPAGRACRERATRWTRGPA